MYHLESIKDITLKSLEDKNELHNWWTLICYFFLKVPKKILKECPKCKNNLTNIEYRDYAKSQWLRSPSNSLLCCISNVSDLENWNLKQFIEPFNLMFVSFDFIEHLIKSFCRVFIHNYCKDINKI